MNIIERLFKKAHKKDSLSNKDDKITVSRISDSTSSEKWEELPAYIPAAPEDYQTVSLIATALAAEYYPKSQFRIKKIEERNPEVKLVALISSCIGAGNADYSQLTIKKVSKKYK